MLISELAGRNVAVLGAGREGKAAWRALREKFPGQPLTLYSEGGFEGFDAPLLADDRLVEGPLPGAQLATHEVLIRSPGISPYREALRVAQRAGAEVTTGSNLWLADNPRARTLCVTGTKGKSTTAALLAHLLEAAGQRVALAGNIGRPLLDCDPAEADWWVIELSSYQLCDLQASPWLALVLNLSDEHLDWHEGTDNYRRDKLRLLELAPESRRFANGGDAGLRAALGRLAGVTWYNQPDLLPVHDGALWDHGKRLPGLAAAPGEHNLVNLAGALAVVDALGLRPKALDRVLAGFRGLPHRQAALGSCGSVRLIDDSLSTTPVATLAALHACGDGPVTVLLGGLDRGIDWGAHGGAFRALAPHAVIGLPDSGASIIAALQAAGVQPAAGYYLAACMQEAVDVGLERTPEDGVLLLSPGAPSFPHYEDYAARARAFHAAARARGAVDRPAEDEGETAGRQG